MTDQIVTLKNRRLHFGLIGRRVASVFGGAKPVGSITVDRLDAVVHEPEGVTPDGHTLAVGAIAIILIVDHLAKVAKYADSPRQQFVVAATVRFTKRAGAEFTPQAQP